MPEPFPGFNYLTDEQYRRIAAAGKLPKNRAAELKNRLEYDISHFKLDVVEFKGAATSKTVKDTFEDIEKHSRRLLLALKSHPEIKARLAGIASNDERFENDPLDGRQMVDERTAGIHDIRMWAKYVLALGTGGRDIWFPGGPSSNPPKNLFVSVLLNFWRHNLDRDAKNWFNQGRERDSIAAFTDFVHECFDVAGHPSKSIEATRQRIRRVLDNMNKSEAAGRGWRYS